MSLNPKTEEYLRDQGVEEEVLADLRAGRPVSITAESLRGWMARAYREGRSFQVELLGQAGRSLDRALERRESDRETLDRFTARLHRLSKLENRSREFQSLVADCLLWFDGFAAAHAGKESWEQPSIPARDRLREMNAVLLDLQEGEPAPIPF